MLRKIPFLFLTLTALPMAQTDVDSLTLERALERVFGNHPALEAGRHAVSARTSAIEQAARGPNPELGVEVEDFAGTGGYSGVDAAQTTVQLNQQLELGSKRGKRGQVAAAEMKLAETELEKKRVDLRAQTRAHFLEALSMQKRSGFSVESQNLAMRLLETVSKRVQEGAASSADELRARLAVAEAKMEIRQDSIRLAGAKRKLSLLWGDGHAPIPALRGNLDSLPALPPLEELHEAIARSPEAALRAGTVRMAEARLQLQQSLGRPDLGLSAGIRHAAGPGDVALVAGITVPLPIRNRNQGGKAEARHEIERARAEEKSALLDLNSTATGFHQELSSAKVEAETLRENLLPDAGKAVQVLEDGYKRGRFGMVDVLTAKSDLFRMQLRYLGALLRYQQGFVELETLIGKGN